MDIRQAHVLVTGGSSGIGYGTARLLAERGARVAICGRKEDALWKAGEEIGALAIPADVSSEQDVIRLVETVIRELGEYNVLINNAGFGVFAPLVDTTLEGMTSVFATNVFGAMMVARESARHFIERSSGNIINIASTASQRGFEGGGSYCASKFALRGLTECWRAELRRHNIRVMQVNPSEVVTEFFGRAGKEQQGNPTKLRPDEIAHVIVGMLEMNDRGFVTDTTIWATNPR